MKINSAFVSVVSVGVALLINGCSSVPEESDQPKPSYPAVQAGQVMAGKVIGVIDGATLKILTSSNVDFRVRLAEIDVPEKYQAFWDKAKNALADKTTGKEVTLRVVRQDPYGGIDAFVYIGQRGINMEMVAEGWAWRAQYSRISELAQVENEARKKRVGLWVDENPMPPWEYRNQRMNPPEEHGRNDGRNIQPLFKVQW